MQQTGYCFLLLGCFCRLENIIKSNSILHNLQIIGIHKMCCFYPQISVSSRACFSGQRPLSTTMCELMEGLYLFRESEFIRKGEVVSLLRNIFEGFTPEERLSYKYLASVGLPAPSTILLFLNILISENPSFCHNAPDFAK